mgnify:CR=1 FL=1
MKKILYTLGLTVLLASCGSNYLDTVPQSSTGTATIFETTQNAKLAINGICRLMVNQYLSSQGFNGEDVVWQLSGKRFSEIKPDRMVFHHQFALSRKKYFKLLLLPLVLLL